jgi:tRNA1Val (adenine37-N6)-methyltransferase
MKTTRDSVWNGRLVLEQPAKGEGYRFCLDPILLAQFVELRKHEHVLELGAGCGVLGLMLLESRKLKQVTAVELQPALSRLALVNAQRNGWESSYRLIEGDLRTVELPMVDGVIFNPPYFKDGHGSPSPNKIRDQARHERHGSLQDFVEAGSRSLHDKAWLAAIVPAVRGDEMIDLCRQRGLAKIRQRKVRPHLHANSNQILFQAWKCGCADLDTIQDLVVHDEQSPAFSNEVAMWLQAPV